MILVDVIFITYNQEQYVAQGIESIISQKVRDNVRVRVIVADDCSNDNTLEIIKSYQDKSPFEFLYTNFGKNLGYHKNYQKTFELCNGNYVAILEGDDWWHNVNHIQQHVDFLQKYNGCSMSFNRIRRLIVTEDKYSIDEWIFPYDFFKITLKYQIICGNLIGNLSACIFRTSYIKKIPLEFYKINFADWELGMFMAQYGYIGYLKDSTSTYRIDYNGQWTQLDVETKKRSMMCSFDEMDAFFKYKYHNWFEDGKYNLEHDINPSIYTSWKTHLKRILSRFSFNNK